MCEPEPINMNSTIQNLTEILSKIKKKKTKEQKRTELILKEQRKETQNIQDFKYSTTFYNIKHH